MLKRIRQTCMKRVTSYSISIKYLILLKYYIKFYILSTQQSYSVLHRDMMKNHIRWHIGYVNRYDRNSLNNHKSCLVGLQGFPHQVSLRQLIFWKRSYSVEASAPMSLMATMSVTDLTAISDLTEKIEEKTLEESLSSQNS